LEVLLSNKLETIKENVKGIQLLNQMKQESKRLRDRQDDLLELGATEMIMSVLSRGRDPASMPNYYEKLMPEMLTFTNMMLEGGNPNVQGDFIQRFIEKQGSFCIEKDFFLAIRAMFRHSSQELHTQMSAVGNSSALAVQLKQDEQMQETTDLLASQLNFVQLMCEGHNRQVQEFLHTQKFESIVSMVGSPTINLVSEVSQICSTFADDMQNEFAFIENTHFNSNGAPKMWNGRRRKLISWLKLDTATKGAKFARFIMMTKLTTGALESLTEMVQGPCQVNQIALARGRLTRIFQPLLEYCGAMQLRWNQSNGTGRSKSRGTKRFGQGANREADTRIMCGYNPLDVLEFYKLQQMHTNAGKGGQVWRNDPDKSIIDEKIKDLQNLQDEINDVDTETPDTHFFSECDELLETTQELERFLLGLLLGMMEGQTAKDETMDEVTLQVLKGIDVDICIDNLNVHHRRLVELKAEKKKMGRWVEMMSHRHSEQRDEIHAGIVREENMCYMYYTLLMSLNDSQCVAEVVMNEVATFQKKLYKWDELAATSLSDEALVSASSAVSALDQGRTADNKDKTSASREAEREREANVHECSKYCHSVVGRIEIQSPKKGMTGKGGGNQLEVVYFPIPQVVLTRWKNWEVQKSKNEMLYIVKRDNPDEKVKDLLERGQHVINVLQHQETLAQMAEDSSFGWVLHMLGSYNWHWRRLLLALTFALNFGLFALVEVKGEPYVTSDGSPFRYGATSDPSVQGLSIEQCIEENGGANAVCELSGKGYIAYEQRHAFLTATVLPLCHLAVSIVLFMSDIIIGGWLHIMNGLEQKLKRTRELWHIDGYAITSPTALKFFQIIFRTKKHEKILLPWWWWAVAYYLMDATTQLVIFLFSMSLLGNFAGYFSTPHPTEPVSGHAPFWFIFCLADVVAQSRTMKNVIRSVTENLNKLAMTLMLTTILLFVFASIAFFHDDFRNAYSFEDGHMDCTSLWECLKIHLNYGLLYSPLWEGRGNIPGAGMPFVISYNVIVNLVITAIVSGIIIDSFSQLREQNDEILEDMRDKCFICGIEREQFDMLDLNFMDHIRKDHNMWQYLWFKMHLAQKDPTEYTGQEQYVQRLLDKPSTKFFPVKKAMCIEGKGTSVKKDMMGLFVQMEGLHMKNRTQEKQIGKMRNEMQQMNQLLAQIYTEVSKSK
jgi:hypothetical protein